MDMVDAVHQVISQFTRVNSVSPTEYESRSVEYIDKGGRVQVEVVVDVYNRHGAINSVTLDQPKTVDTQA